mmetsp:Transcript_51145/g.118874  ORF Transcript_51145/g.118874 Transcript_51145/m.118874 type:complete len:350 (-) Transcript_51145:99-1148(-)
MEVGGSPPGLWQPPGLGGIGGPPPAMPPPPAPGGFSFGAVGEGRERRHELQKEISGTIEAQVSRLVEQARHDTESKVKLELKQIRDAMLSMDARLDQLLAQLDAIEPREPLEPSLDAEQVGQLLSKIEQQWGQEIRTLKQELHQTILAHNHNADLIKHHKDTIDALRERCLKLQGGSVKTSEIQQQLQRLDARLKQQQKQRKLEPLFDRLAVVEQRVAAAQQGAAWRYQAQALQQVGVPVPPGIPPTMMPGLAVEGARGAADTDLEPAIGGGTASSTASLGAAAASAAGMMAKTPGAKGMAAGATVGAKAGERAAYKCPTDEEVQAHLSKLSVAAEPSAADGASEEAAA